MSVYVRNLVINTSADFNEDLELTQLGGAPINLEGFAGLSHMRKTPESSSYVGFGLSITNPSEGKIQISMASTVTEDLKSGRYVYDVMLIAPNGNKTIAVEGTVLVRGGISTGCF